VKLEVKLFARAKELAGASSVELDVSESADVAELRRALAARVPALKDLAPRLHVSVGNEYARDATPVGPATEIACFPPVSGG
jgi:molybdopterin converting factor subunit 1